MDNAILIVLFIGVVIFVISDHITYWKQISNFTSRANELAVIYNNILKRFQNESDDVKIIEYEGMFYTVKVKNGDYRSFVFRIQEITADVKKAYDEIDPRYLMQADEETAEDIETLRKKIEEIDYAVRMTIWKNGWKK